MSYSITNEEMNRIQIEAKEKKARDLAFKITEKATIQLYDLYRQLRKIRSCREKLPVHNEVEVQIEGEPSVEISRSALVEMFDKEEIRILDEIIRISEEQVIVAEANKNNTEPFIFNKQQFDFMLRNDSNFFSDFIPVKNNEGFNYR